MNKKTPKLIVGFIIFGQSTAEYLPYFLPSLKAQTYKNFKALAFDSLKMKENKPYRPIKDGSSTKYIKKEYPEIEMIDSLKNTGFGRSHNKMIDKARQLGADYYLVINCDVTLEPNALEEMVSILDNDKETAAISPKILKWDFVNNKKSKVIDTYGIGLKPGLRFFNIGQGKNDEGVVDHDIIGPSGACGLYRVDILEKIAESGKYFDENMFMYKEDCDLAYRLYLAGYQTRFASQAVLYHDRTAFGKKGFFAIFKNRRKRDPKINKWSFLNQQMIFLKYWAKQGILSKLMIVLWQIKAFFYLLLFEQYLLLEYLNLFKIEDNIRKYK